MEQPYIYQLKELLEYSKDGKFESTGEIIFDPPSMSNLDEVSDFEQILMGAIISAGKSQKDMVDNSEEEEGGPMKTPTANEIRMLLFIGQDVSVKKIVKVFKLVALKTGRLDEKIKLKESHFAKMDRKDFIDMLCGYASFFTFPSLLRGE